MPFTTAKVAGSNGFIYTRAGVFQGLLTGIGHQSDFKDVGLADSSTAQITLPRFYASEDCNPEENRRIMAVPYDRFYYRDERILVPEWELIEANPTGRDRLKFPAVEVVLVIDARGVRYHCGQDFVVESGQIKWLGQNQPGRDAESGRGVIYSVRYHYRPFWYLRSKQHEIRVTQHDNPLTGEREIERMPQAATVQREYIFHNSERDDPDSSSARVYAGPSDGSFTPK